MRIGITLNETVRCFNDTVDEVYGNYMNSIKATGTDFLEHKHVDTLDMTNTTLDAKNPDEFILIKTENNKKRSILSLPESYDLLDISNSYPFEDIEEYNTFLYEDFAFQIFSRGGLTYQEAMNDLNNLYNELVTGGHNVTIVSQERKNSKQATLLFLSQNRFQGNNIKFLYDYTKIWDLYDIIITANPFIISSKPKNKLCIKIETEVNMNRDSDETFKNLYEIYQFYKKNRKK